MADQLPVIDTKRAMQVLSGKAPKYLPADSIRAMIDYETGRHHDRYKLIFALLWHTGCRIGELLDLHRSDIDFYNSLVRIRTEKAKGDERMVYVDKALLNDLAGWLERNKIGTDDPIFDLTQTAVYMAVRKVATALELPKFTHTHTFRHSFAVNYLLSGGDLISLKTILGHRRIETTMRYLLITKADSMRHLQEMGERGLF